MTATWTTPRTWATGEVVTAALLNAHLSDNLDYLKARPQVAYFSSANDGNITSTSGSYVNISSDYSKTITTTAAGRVQVTFMAGIGTSGSNVQMKLYVDGVDSGLIALVTSGTIVVALSRIVTGLSAGSHTFEIRWACIGGVTATLNRLNYSSSFVLSEV